MSDITLTELRIFKENGVFYLDIKAQDLGNKCKGTFKRIDKPSSCSVEIKSSDTEFIPVKLDGWHLGEKLSIHGANLFEDSFGGMIIIDEPQKPVN